MKFRFKAIDSQGRIVEGVLRADSEQHAREVMLEDNVFPKQMEPVDEKEKVTWAPRTRVKATHAAPAQASWHTRAAGEPMPVNAVFQTVAITGFPRAVAGKAGLNTAGSFVFVPAGGGKDDAETIAPADIEVAAVCGFPGRILRITRLDGKMFEFRAGFLFAQGEAKAIVRALRQ